jgi:hypothetical protein
MNNDHKIVSIFDWFCDINPQWDYREKKCPINILGHRYQIYNEDMCISMEYELLPIRNEEHIKLVCVHKGIDETDFVRPIEVDNKLYTQIKCDRDGKWIDKFKKNMDDVLGEFEFLEMMFMLDDEFDDE